MLHRSFPISDNMTMTSTTKYAATFILLLISILSYSQKLEFKEKSDGVLLVEEGQPRFFYRILPEKENQQFSRVNYVHPLYGLNGEILTEDFPDDHPHHHGIFWAWHQLYANGERVADPWLNEGISWKVVQTNIEVQEQKGNLTSEILWIQTSEDKAIIKEDLSISFNRLGEDVFTLLFDITLTALTDGVAIGGSEDAKGYGGFSPRFVLPEDVTFHSVNGEVKPEVLAVQAGPWMNLRGSFDPSDSGQSGIVIMGEPEKLPSFQGWILRSAESMQNMAFPGRDTVSILKGESLKFRNQLVIHKGLSQDEIQEIYKDFFSERSLSLKD